MKVVTKVEFSPTERDLLVQVCRQESKDTRNSAIKQGLWSNLQARLITKSSCDLDDLQPLCAACERMSYWLNIDDGTEADPFYKMYQKIQEIMEDTNY